MTIKRIYPVSAWLVLAAVLASSTVLRGQVPPMIHYQGRVSVSGVPFTGGGLFKFALIRTDSGATTWSNDGTSSNGSEPTASVGIPVAQGLYSVNLGDTAIPNMASIPLAALSAADVRLRIWFSDGPHGFQALAPDVRLTSVPYSLVAASVPNGSITAAQLGAGSVSGVVIGCNLGADQAEVFVQGLNVFCGVGAGTPVGGFSYTLVNVPAGSHTLKARLPNGTTLSQGVIVTQGGSLSGVNFNFGCGTCGDGTTQTERGEGCDDGNTTPGDGCSATCQIEVPFCSNTIVEAGEECDDGNLSAGDGCSPVCKVEPVNESEPNNTFGTANTGFVVGPGSIARAIAGSIGSAGDHDVFGFTVTAAGVVHLETFDGTGTGCSGGMTTLIRLLDAGGAEIVADLDSGINGCSALSYHLAAGSYFLQVEEDGDDATIANYIAKVTYFGPGGAESEPNNQLSTSGNVAGAQVFVSGDHSSAFDEDWFRVTLFSTRSIWLEVVEGNGLETCDGSGIDSQLEVYTAAGILLSRDDDAGRGFCSLLDGTGSTPAQPELHNLPAGVYYVRLTASPFADADGSQFVYRLAVGVR